jgi:hypothetical protein
MASFSAALQRLLSVIRPVNRDAHKVCGGLPSRAFGGLLLANADSSYRR